LSKNESNKNKIFFYSLFPLSNILNNNLLSATVINTSELNLQRILKPGEIVHINPETKLIIKQFFSRSFRWNQKSIPSYFEVNSSGTSAILNNNFTFSLINTRDRNRKTYLRFLLH
jgi:hypothetical protein